MWSEVFRHSLKILKCIFAIITAITITIFFYKRESVKIEIPILLLLQLLLLLLLLILQLRLVVIASTTAAIAASAVTTTFAVVAASTAITNYYHYYYSYGDLTCSVHTVNNLRMFNCQCHFYLCNRGTYVRLAFMPNMLSSWNKDIIIIVIHNYIIIILAPSLVIKRLHNFAFCNILLYCRVIWFYHLIIKINFEILTYFDINPVWLKTKIEVAYFRTLKVDDICERDRRWHVIGRSQEVRCYWQNLSAGNFDNRPTRVWAELGSKLVNDWPVILQVRYKTCEKD